MSDVMTVAKKKKAFTFQKYLQQIQRLDMEDVGYWHVSVKITIYAIIVVVVALITYFFVVSSMREEINQAEAQEEILLSDYKAKVSKLRHLAAYKKQLEIMENQFQQQLSQLPKQTEIPGLVEDINASGVRADLNFKNIQLLPEIRQEIFIEQPIDITVEGNYHSFGRFVSAISSLPRIVTLGDFTISLESNNNFAVPKLNMNIKAKTYRYIDESVGGAK